MDKDLKIFALEYVKLHDNLLKEEKLAIGEFIMKASDDQIAFLLITGEVKDNITENDIKIMSETVKSGDATAWVKGIGNAVAGKDVGYGRNVGIATGLAAAAVVAAATVAAFKIYKSYFSKAAKACKGKGGIDKKNCMEKFKKDAQAAKVKALQSGMAKCSKAKDSTTCKSKLQNKINKEKAKMGAL